MDIQFFNKKSLTHLSAPFQELIDLNVKTMQSFLYIKPEELSKLKKPEELMARNMDVFIQNSHNALKYMQHSFDILSNHWLNISENIKEDSKTTTSQKQKTESTAKKPVVKSKSKSTLKKVSAPVKKNLNQAKPIAQKSSAANKASPKKSVNKISTQPPQQAKVFTPKPEETIKANKSVIIEEKRIDVSREIPGAAKISPDFNKEHLSVKK